jgi:phosphatidylglycerophosphate synthase
MTDEIVIIGTFLITGYKFDVALFYLGLLMLIREYAVDTMRAIATTRHIVISADVFSKLKGVLFMVTMLCAIGNHTFLENEKFEQAIVLLGNNSMILAYLTLGRFYLKCKALQVF